MTWRLGVLLMVLGAVLGFGCSAPAPGKLPVDNQLMQFEAPDKDDVTGGKDDDGDWDLEEEASGSNDDGGNPCGEVADGGK